MRRIKRTWILVLLISSMACISCSSSRDKEEVLVQLPDIVDTQSWMDLSFRARLQYSSGILATNELGDITGLQTRFGRGSIFTKFHTGNSVYVKDFSMEYTTYTSNGEISLTGKYVYPIVQLGSISSLNFSYNIGDSEIDIRLSGELLDSTDKLTNSECIRYNTHFTRYKNEMIDIRVKRRGNNSLVYKYKKKAEENKRFFLCIYNKYRELITYIELTEKQGDFDGYIDYGGTHFSIIIY